MVYVRTARCEVSFSKFPGGSSEVSSQRFSDMIDMKNAISIGRAARSLPSSRPDEPVSNQTVHRWITAGVHGVRLEAVKLGAKWMTDPAAIDRFVRELTESRVKAVGTAGTDDGPEGGGRGGVGVEVGAAAVGVGGG